MVICGIIQSKYKEKGRQNFMISIKKTGMAILFAGLIVNISACAFGAPNYNFTAEPKNASSGALQGQVVYVPAGITAPAILSNGLSSEYATVGMQVNVTLPTAITYNGKTVAPAGSVLNGTVTKCKKAGIGNRNGQIQVIFNNLRTPQGYSIAINAVFKTDDNSGILKGGTKIDSAKDYGKNAVLGAGSGAALGTAMGALSGGSVGKGAIYGTAIGGGIGVANAVRQKGENVQIPANVTLDVYFTQPITVSAPNIYNY